MTEQMRYAGFWVRALASLIDTFIIIAASTPPLLYLYGFEKMAAPDAPLFLGVADFLISVVLPAAAVIWFWRRFQATPGKMLLRTSIVDANTGEQASLKQLVIRYLGYFPAMLPLFAGIFWVAFDPRKQGWHDKLAGTVVIQRRDETKSAFVLPATKERT